MSKFVEVKRNLNNDSTLFGLYFSSKKLQQLKLQFLFYGGRDMYKRPRIKEIYPVYRLDQEHFRIGAQIGITKEFYDPTEQLWNLATILDGRSLKDVLDEERRRFPDLELSDDYILDGINLLDQEGFLEETDLKEEECLNARYMPNVRYFSHYINSTNDRFHVQKK